MPSSTSTGVRGLGFLSLSVALGAAVVLSLAHLGAARVPGCGLDSPCGRALSGPFGTLPVLDWPVAFAGAAFFGALLAAWTWAGRGAGWPLRLRWVARVGGVLSLVFIGLAVQQRSPCPFCLAAQLANLAFVACSERSCGPARARAPEAAFLVAGVVTSAILFLARAQGEAAHHAAEERALAESTRAVESGVGARAFTGRFRRGAERAALRLVLFTDYQCEDCARIEREAWQLAEERADLSLSIKHFPLCRDCNRRARDLDHNPHPNACWAARAAEAAGILGDAEGFWRMHRWLFERGGAFREAELRAALPGLGFEAEPFLASLRGAETLARVQADVEEALSLGIHSTPLVFLNGVELRGWNAPAALRRAIEALARAAPEPASAEADRPPGALEKGLADWRVEPRVVLPARPGAPRAAAPGRDALEIVLWSDYLEPSTRELDRRLRAFRASHPEARYSFRHYPLDPECVPSAPSSHPGACRAAFAAEAARLLAGEGGFERYHAWLMETPAPLDDEALRRGARECGLDPAALLDALGQPSVRAVVEADVAAARALRVHSIPFLFVGGRRVPRWRVEGVELLEPLLREALESP